MASPIPISALTTEAYLKLFTTYDSPTFLGVPQSIRNKIYTYLLSTAHTQCSPKENLLNTPTPTSYKFHTAILHVNKQIQKEARPVLYKENTFITFWCSLSFFSKMFVTWDFPLVAEQVHSKPDSAAFPEKTAIMHIRAFVRPRSRDVNDGGCTFVLAAQDLPKLAQTMYEMDLQLPKFSSSLDLELTVRTGRIVPDTERMLLGPMRELRGLKKTVIRGNVTPAYAREAETLMMTRRGISLKKILHEGIKMKEEGNRIVKKTGDWEKAMRKWLNVTELIGGSNKSHPSVFDFAELATHREIQKLLIAVGLNITMAQYKLKNYRAVIGNAQLLFKTFGDEEKSTPMERAKIYFRKGLAYTAMGMEEEAIADLNRALRLSPGDVDILVAIKAAEKHAVLRQRKEEKSEMEKVFGPG
ncbi:MAG: peptidyl-prolyl cis-trans isomerase cpr6 [Candelina mexicana]|nr:MAG: peptidyl-prolyl cis-trans isomerase cpr6 [Candelina mexicana]